MGFDKEKMILGLDISTSCIGVTLLLTNGIDEPKIIQMTHVSPKISSNKKGVEALILRKEAFEHNFLTAYKDLGITDVVIEEPLLSANNVDTVATLLRFNGMISEAIYRVLGIVPVYISSYDARKYSFPELMSIRKYNKAGKCYSLSHVKKCIKDNHLVLFGAYPFDIYKKQIMMNLVSDKFPYINWIYDKDGELKKENYDACDSLVCVLAYINLCNLGEEQCEITTYKISYTNKEAKINYKVKIWDRLYDKLLTIPI